LPNWWRSQKNARQAQFGSAGVGTPVHLTGEMFKALAGIDLQHVPYKGSAPAVTDLIGGQIQIMFDPLQSVLSNVQGGKLRALAVSTRRAPRSCPTCRPSRSPVTTHLKHHGVGVFAPAKMPGIVPALRRRVARIAYCDGFPQQTRAACVTPVTHLAGATLRISSARNAKWGKAVRDAGVKAD
jgi:tripartite-type tricarboxylate transporter receptor subunit TctC